MNGASSTISYRTITSETGRPLRYEATIEVTAWLDGSGQADLTAKEIAFNAALAVPYKDLVFRQDSGAPTGTILLNNQSLSGVRIMNVRYANEAKDGEYVISRVCRFTAVATYFFTGSQNAIISWAESITAIGTSAGEVVWRPMVNGPPVAQLVYPQTTYKLSQKGHAVGHTGYPPIPPPLFPWPIEKGSRRVVTAESPKREGQGLIEYPVSWNYEYESDLPLIAFPSIPPL